MQAATMATRHPEYLPEHVRQDYVNNRKPRAQMSSESSSWTMHTHPDYIVPYQAPETRWGFYQKPPSITRFQQGFSQPLALGLFGKGVAKAVTVNGNLGRTRRERQYRATEKASIDTSIGSNRLHVPTPVRVLEHILRFVQFFMALAVIGLYGQNLDTAHRAPEQDAAYVHRWGYAVTIGVFSCVSVVILIWPRVKNIIAAFRWTLWEFIMFLLWLVVFGIFARLYIPVDPQGDKGLIREKHAVWVNLVNVILWLFTCALSTSVHWTRAHYECKAETEWERDHRTSEDKGTPEPDKPWNEERKAELGYPTKARMFNNLGKDAASPWGQKSLDREQWLARSPSPQFFDPNHQDPVAETWQKHYYPPKLPQPALNPKELPRFVKPRQIDYDEEYYLGQEVVNFRDV